MLWHNHELSRTLEDLALRAQLAGESVFRTKAYEKAAVTVRLLQVDVTTLSAKELAELPGIGAATVEKIQQWQATGTMEELEAFKTQVPDGVLTLVKVPGLGNKTAIRLHQELGVIASKPWPM